MSKFYSVEREDNSEQWIAHNVEGGDYDII